MSKLLLTFTLAGAAAAVYFEAGETMAQCHLDSAGNTVVHFDHVSQKSFKCTHNTARTTTHTSLVILPLSAPVGRVDPPPPSPSLSPPRFWRLL